MKKKKDLYKIELRRNAVKTLRESFNFDARKRNDGLAIRAVENLFFNSLEVETSARMGALVSDPFGSDRNFSTQITTKIIVYDPNAPHKGFGEGYIRRAAQHKPAPRDFDALEKLLDWNAEVATRRAVEDYKLHRIDVEKQAAVPRTLAALPRKNINYERNGADLELWDFDAIKGIVCRVSEELEKMSSSKLLRDTGAQAIIFWDQYRKGSAEVPIEHLKGFRGRGQLNTQAIYSVDTRGLLYLRARMKTKSDRKGISGIDQKIYYTVPMFFPRDIQTLESEALVQVNKIKPFVSAESLEGGREYPAVFDPDPSSFVIHEAIAAHRISGEWRMNRISGALPNIGSELFNTKRVRVDIYDDPTLKDGFGSYAFDIDGIPAERTQIVRNGKLAQLLSSRIVGGFLRKNSTGNSRVQGFNPTDELESFSDEDSEYNLPLIPSVRMSNTVTICKNPKRVSELHSMARHKAKSKGLKHYLLITRICGADVDSDGTVKGIDVLGYKVSVDNSRQREPFRGVHISTNATNLLMGIQGMSKTTIDRSQYRNGRCGDDSGWLGVSEVTPWLYHKALPVVGVSIPEEGFSGERKRKMYLR